MDEKKTQKKTDKAQEKEQKYLEQIEKLTAEAEDFKEKWMRNVAEFDNYKKRNAKLYSEAYSSGISDVILKILPVGDNLEWALTLGLDEKTAEGIRKVIEKYNETLKGLDVEEINPIGEVFDPNIAEAVMQAPADDRQEPDTVKQVFQKGYKLKDKIIRYAKVCVVK